MATIGQHISNLKGIINQYSRTPESRTDQFLYEILIGARSELVKQKLVKYNKLSDDFYQRFCMKLELVNAEDCSCVPDEIQCKVLRTKYKLPKSFTSRNANMVWVSLLNGKSISIMSINKWRLVGKSDDYIASYVNGYIYFWNLPLSIKVVEILGLFHDPAAFQDILDCNGLTGEEVVQCYNVTTSDFPLEEEYKNVVYKKCLELLGIQVQQDITNDSNNGIKM